MKKTRTFEIIDKEEFIKSIREIMLKEFFNEEIKEKEKERKRKKNKHLLNLMKEKEKEIEDKLTIEEAKNIVVPILEEKQKDGKILINHKDFKEILEELNKRIVSNILVQLTKEGLIESAYDSEQNDFIFWVKD